MSDPPNDLLNDDDLKAVWGPCTEPDFNAWREKHTEAVAYLNPVVTQFQQRKRRILMRTIKLSALTLCLGMVIWLVGFREGTPAYAEAMKSLKAAQTVTWTRTSYMQCTSKDGQKSWLHKYSEKFSYRHPGLTRQEFNGEDGNVISVIIEDAVEKEELLLNLKEKSAILSHVRETNTYPEGPLSYINSNLQSATEFVKTIDGPSGPAYLFRDTIQELKAPGRYIQGRTHEFLIDVKTKQPVEFRYLILPFDPKTADTTKVPPGTTLAPVGIVYHDIVLNAEIAPELFSLKPPADYKLEIKERPTATEEEMVEYFGATAKAHNGIFGVGGLIDSDLYRVATSKDKGDRTEKEQAIVDLVHDTSRRFVYKGPEDLFITDHSIPGSYRYIGKGVKLGDKDRIICWYRLKTTGQYRAVYGDLTVKDIDPKDLPLEVK